MNNYNLDNLLVLANNAVIPNIFSADETSNGTLSFGVVNSNSNGKRKAGIVAANHLSDMMCRETNW